MRTVKMILVSFLIIAIGIVVLNLLMEEVSGKTITVDDKDADYEKIQDAINAAETGDTVRVYGGIYAENIVVDKSINLIGNGSETTTIDGGGEGDVVNVTMDWVNISGFRVTGSGSFDWQGYHSGIRIGSDNCRIFKNNCSENTYGIHLWESSNSIIENNTCSLNNESGIDLWFSSNSTLKNNICENDQDGINVRASTACIIENNICSNNENGIYLLSINCTIKNNSCSYNHFGISLWESSNSTLDNNTCSSNNEDGIDLSYSSYATLENNICENNQDGISLWESSNSIIENNTCSSNYNDGISFRSSGDCIIENNTCLNNNGNGINLSYSGTYRITNNTCSSNEFGMYLRWSPGIIEYNTCSSNNLYGIYLFQYHGGEIKNNTCSNNDFGMYLEHSTECTIMHNNCSLNNEVGIHLLFCTDCTIENNSGTIEVKNDHGESGFSTYEVMKMIAISIVLLFALWFIIINVKINRDRKNGI